MASRWLLLTTDFRPMSGGIARLLGTVVDLASPDVEWRCLTLAKGDAEAGVHRYDNFASLSRAVPRHARWLRGASERQVVCGHAYLQAPALAAKLAGRARLTTMVYGTEIVPKRAVHRGALSLLRFSDGIIADSRYAADTTASELGVRGDRMRVVLPEFRSPYTASNPPVARKPGERLRLVTVSRLKDIHKNIELGVRAVSVLSATGLIDRYTIIGDGPQREALQRLAQVPGVEHLVEFPGALGDEETRCELASCHVGLFPSRRVDNYFEGFGMVVHELAAAGLPMLVGDSGGTSDACAGDWARLLDPEDLRAWVSEIERLATDEERRIRMASDAYNWASAIDSAATVRRYEQAVRGEGT